MRALVLDQGLDRGSLAAVRALHDDGWSVGVGSPFRGLAGASRFAERWHRVPAAEGGVEDYIDAVAGAVAQGPHRVVFSADDVGVLALSRHRDEIGAVVPYADHATVVRSIDKLEMTRAAERAGSPCRERPRRPTRPSPGRRADDRHAATALRPPGRRAGAARHDYQRHPPARRARRSARSAVGVEAILQEVVDSELASFHAVIDREGRMLAPVQQHSPRSCPPARARRRAATRSAWIRRCRRGCSTSSTTSGGSGWPSSSSSRPTGAASHA